MSAAQAEGVNTRCHAAFFFQPLCVLSLFFKGARSVFWQPLIKSIHSSLNSLIRRVMPCSKTSVDNCLIFIRHQARNPAFTNYLQISILTLGTKVVANLDISPVYWPTLFLLITLTHTSKLCLISYKYRAAGVHIVLFVFNQKCALPTVIWWVCNAVVATASSSIVLGKFCCSKHIRDSRGANPLILWTSSRGGPHKKLLFDHMMDGFHVLLPKTLAIKLIEYRFFKFPFKDWQQWGYTKVGLLWIFPSNSSFYFVLN